MRGYKRYVPSHEVMYVGPRPKRVGGPVLVDEKRKRKYTKKESSASRYAHKQITKRKQGFWVSGGDWVIPRVSRNRERHDMYVWYVLLDCVVLRVKEDFVSFGVVPYAALELGDGVAYSNAHAGWSADEDAGSSSEVLAELAECVGYIGTTVFSAPSVLLLDGGWQERETHKVLLELGWGGWEAEVESLDVVGISSTGRLDEDVWIDGIVPGFDSL